MATDDGVNAALALIPYAGDATQAAGGNLVPEDVVMGSEGVTVIFPVHSEQCSPDCLRK